MIQYEDGDEVSVKEIGDLPVFNNRIVYFATLPFHYLLYLTQALWYLRRPSDNKRPRVLMAVNYYCAFCGVVLKKLGAIDVLIYRVMDFFPLPSSGPYRFLNRVFYKLDRLCLTNSDEVWFTTEGHIIGREKYGYFNRTERPYQLIPLGVNASNYMEVPLSEQGSRSLVYCGVVSTYHMLDLLFEVINIVRQAYPDIRLNIIGSGPDLSIYRSLCKDMNLDDRVVFHGFLENGTELHRIISDNVLGIAFYRDEENIMKYTEPAKVKYYLSFGVPALVSNVPRIAEELDAKGVAISVPNNKDVIAKRICEFLNNEYAQIECRRHISQYVHEIDIYHMLDNIFDRFLSDFGAYK